MATREGRGTGCFHPPTVLSNISSSAKAPARGWGGMPLSSRHLPTAGMSSRSSSSSSLSESSTNWSTDGPAAGRQHSFAHPGGPSFAATSSAELDVAAGCPGAASSCGAPVHVHGFDQQYGSHSDTCWLAPSSDSLQLWPAAGASGSFGFNHGSSYTHCSGLNLGPGPQADAGSALALAARRRFPAATARTPTTAGMPSVMPSPVASSPLMNVAASGLPDDQAKLDVLDALDRELQYLLQLKQELTSQAAAAPQGSQAAAAVEGASAAHEAAMRHALSTRLLASESLGCSPAGSSPMVAPQFAWPGSPAAPMPASEVRLSCDDPQVAGPVRSRGPGLAWPCAQTKDAAARAASVQAKLQQLLLAQDVQMQLQQELLCLLPVGGC